MNQIGAPIDGDGYYLEVPATASGTQLTVGNASGPGVTGSSGSQAK
jgi:hypothetical protein